MMKVKRDNIGEIIGKGGATIKDIIEKSGARIDISDSGNVKIAEPIMNQFKPQLN